MKELEVEYWNRKAAGTAIVLNTLAHYAALVPQAFMGTPFRPLAFVLALMSSVPLAGLSYALSVLLHRVSAHDAGTHAADVQLQIELGQREQLIRGLRDRCVQGVEQCRTLEEHCANLGTRCPPFARTTLRTRRHSRSYAKLNAPPAPSLNTNFARRRTNSRADATRMHTYASAVRAS